MFAAKGNDQTQELSTAKSITVLLGAAAAALFTKRKVNAPNNVVKKNAPVTETTESNGTMIVTLTQVHSKSRNTYKFRLFEG